MTATAKTETLNAALSLIGEPGIESLDADPLPGRVQTMLGLLDGRAGVELWAVSRHPWLCCTTFATLSPSVRAGNWKFAKVFDLPDTFVKMVTVDGCSDLAFEVGTEEVAGAIKKVVRSNETSLDVAFTEQKPFEAYTTDLLAVIAHEAAARAAGPIKGDAALGRNLHAAALELLAAAETGEAGQQGGEDPPFAGTFAALRAASA